MTDNELERDLQHKIDEHITRKIESATKVYEKAIEFHEKQVSNVWKYNKLLAATILTAAIGILLFLFGQSLPSMEQSISRRLSNQVDEKFQDPNIQKMISEAAKGFIGEQVEKGYLVVLELMYAINQFDNDVNAIRKIHEVINDSNYPYPKFQELAKQTYKEQRKLIDQYSIREEMWAYEGKCGIESKIIRSGQKDTILEKLAYHIKEGHYPARASCLWILWDQKNIDIKEKLNLTYETLIQEQNPWVIYIACNKVESIAKLQKDRLLETDEYIKWLEKNKDGISKQ